MTTQRTTKTIDTPNGHKVVVYDYITGGEMRKIQALFFEGLTAGDVFKESKTSEAMSKVPVGVLFKAQELTLELLIVSVDGETENAYQKAMDMKEEDLDCLFAEVDKYTSGNAIKKKESQPTTSPDA